MAAYRDLYIGAGSVVEFVIDVVGGPVSLTGYTASMQIRESRGASPALATVGPGAFTVNPTTRQVTVRIPGSETETYAFQRGVYDVMLTGPSGDSWQLVEGRVFSKLVVTRED